MFQFVLPKSHHLSAWLHPFLLCGEKSGLPSWVYAFLLCYY
jgi:hypothetical protein